MVVRTTETKVLMAVMMIDDHGCHGSAYVWRSEMKQTDPRGVYKLEFTSWNSERGKFQARDCQNTVAPLLWLIAYKLQPWLLST